jgi:hypothetical protein
MVASAPLIDPAQFGRRTMNNESLQVEVLALFVAEAERLLRQVEEAADEHIRGDRLRALIALARDVGAMRIAQEARAAETQVGTGEPDLSPLRDAVAQTVAHIGRPEG